MNITRFNENANLTMTGGEEPAPELSVPLRRVSGLRYGENPHQPAAFYADLSLAEAGRGGIAGAIQHHGKEVLR